MVTIFDKTEGKLFLTFMNNFSDFEVYPLKNNLCNCLVRSKQLQMTIGVKIKFMTFKENKKKYTLESIDCYFGYFICAFMIKEEKITDIIGFYGKDLIEKGIKGKNVKQIELKDSNLTGQLFLEAFYSSQKLFLFDDITTTNLIEKDKIEFDHIDYMLNLINKTENFICERIVKRIYAPLSIKHKNFSVSFPVFIASGVNHRNNRYQFHIKRQVEKGLLFIAIGIDDNRTHAFGFKILKKNDDIFYVYRNQFSGLDNLSIKLNRIFERFVNGDNYLKLDNLTTAEINLKPSCIKGDDNRYHSWETEIMSRKIFEKFLNLDERFEVVNLLGNCISDCLIRRKNDERITISIQLKSASVNFRDGNCYQFYKCGKYAGMVIIFIALNYEITKTVGMVIKLGLDITSFTKCYTIDKLKPPEFILNKINDYFNEFDSNLQHPSIKNTSKEIEENRIAPSEKIEKNNIEEFNKNCSFLTIERSPQFSIWDFKLEFNKVIFKVQVKSIAKRFYEQGVSFCFCSSLAKSYNRIKTLYELSDDVDLFLFIYTTEQEKFSYLFTKWELYRMYKISYARSEIYQEDGKAKDAKFNFYPPSFHRNPDYNYLYLWTDIGYINYNSSNLQDFIYMRLLKSYSERRLIEEEIENYARPTLSEEIRVSNANILINEVKNINYQDIIQLMNKDLAENSSFAKDKEIKNIIDYFPYETPAENFARKKQRDFEEEKRKQKEDPFLFEIPSSNQNPPPEEIFFEIPSSYQNPQPEEIFFEIPSSYQKSQPEEIFFEIPSSYQNPQPEEIFFEIPSSYLQTLSTKISPPEEIELYFDIPISSQNSLLNEFSNLSIK